MMGMSRVGIGAGAGIHRCTPGVGVGLIFSAPQFTPPLSYVMTDE